MRRLLYSTCSALLRRGSAVSKTTFPSSSSHLHSFALDLRAGAVLCRCVEPITIARRFRKKGKGRDSHHQKDTAHGIDFEDGDDDEEGGASLDTDAIEEDMSSAMRSLERSFSGLRSSGASASMLDVVFVENKHGSKVPLKSVAQVIVRDARLLEVSCLNDELRSNVVKAVQMSSLNLNPQSDPNGRIRINIPKPNRESRDKMKRIASKEAENTRNAIRRIRRKAMESVKQKTLSTFDRNDFNKSVEDLATVWNKKVDGALDAKIKDIDTI